MTDRRRSVLHVLPHPGGGGERYVDSLSEMTGYRFERIYLARGREPLRAIPQLLSKVPRANLRAGGFDLVHVHGEVPGLLSLPALTRRPSLVTLHGLNFVRRSEGIQAKIAALNLRMLVAAATRIICLTEAERSAVVDVIGDTGTASLEVVPLGVQSRRIATPEERSEARSALDVEDEMVVAMVGALEYPKDPVAAASAAVVAAESGVSLTLLVVGEGRLREQVEKIARASGGVVRLLGHRDDIPRVLAAADVFVLSSLHEGLPYALLDAMAASLPSIITDYPGASESLADAGLIVSRQDVQGLAMAMKRLATNPAERVSLGERARARAAETFSSDAMLECTRGLYDELVA